MEPKKTVKADVVKLRSTLLLIGLLSSLLLVLGAFSLKLKPLPTEELAIQEVDDDIEVIEATVQDLPEPDYQPPPPPENAPPPPEQQVATQVVETKKEVKKVEFMKQDAPPPPPAGPPGPPGPVGPPQPKKTDEIFELYNVSKKAEFKGGAAEMNKFIAKNIIYPVLAREEGIEGRVVVEFIVGTKGEILEPKVLGKKLGFGCEEEALRVVKAMNGLWTPAEQGDKKVKMRFKLPIKFKLN